MSKENEENIDFNIKSIIKQHKNIKNIVIDLQDKNQLNSNVENIITDYIYNMDSLI